MRKAGLSLTFLSLLFLSSCGFFSGIKQADQIILITLDTTRADRLGCYGYKNVKTPNLDQIASNGILFKNAICQVPVTLPSHSTMMTGLYPVNHGVRSNHRYRLIEIHKTLAEILKDKGYDTGAVISAQPLARKYGIAQGFDYFEESFLEEFMDQPEMIKERRAGDSVEVALNWLKDKKDKKFFFWLHLYDPHFPYDPPPPFYEKYKDHRYDGEISYMDEALGHFFHQLKEWNILDRSFLFIVGDHGEGLMEHGEQEHQYLIYGSNIRIPLIIHYPVLRGKGIVEDLVAAVDVFPTILDLCHIEKVFAHDGRSLIPYLKNPSKPLERTPYYIESLSGDISFGWCPLYGLREGEWKYIEAPEKELYNVAEDPDERENLALYEMELIERMAENLEDIKGESSELSQEKASELELPDGEAMKLASLGYVGMTRSTWDSGRIKKNPKDYVFIERDALKAFQFLLRDKHDLALPLLLKVLESDPENKSALLHSAECYLKLGEWDKAQSYFETFLSHYPDLMKGYDELIKIYSEKKEWNKLRDLILNALTYFEEDFKARKILFSSLLQEAGCNASIPILNEAVKKEQEMASLYFYLAKCYTIEGDDELAIANLDSTLEKDQNNVYLSFALHDETFQRIRERAEFSEIVSKYQKKRSNKE